MFDIARGMPWPDDVSGRVIRNRFLERWQGREEELRAWADTHREEYLVLATESETAESAIWAGEAASLVTGIEHASDVVRDLVADTTEILRNRPRAVLREL